MKKAYGREIIEDKAAWKLAKFVAENSGNVRLLFFAFL